MCRYVKIAYHGLGQLSKQARQEMYAGGTTRQSFVTDDFTTIDTLFSLAEAYLFMQIVDLKDTLQHPVLNNKPYEDIYRDIRGAVDLCHRDGSLKTEVAANPSKFIQDVRPTACVAAHVCDHAHRNCHCTVCTSAH